MGLISNDLIIYVNDSFTMSNQSQSETWMNWNRTIGVHVYLGI